MLWPTGLARAGGRYRTRLVVGLLATSIPIVALVVVGLTALASSALQRATERRLTVQADEIGESIDRFVVERRNDLHLLASTLAGRPPTEVATVLGQVPDDAYDVLQVSDLSGGVVAVVPPGEAVNPGERVWFRTAAAGQPVVSEVYTDRDEVRWIVAEPMAGPDGRPAAVAIGDVRIEALAAFLDESFATSDETVLVDAQRRLRPGRGQRPRLHGRG
jgi:hypothetical protein